MPHGRSRPSLLPENLRSDRYISTGIVWQQPILLLMLAGPGAQTGHLVLSSQAEDISRVVEDGWLDGFQYDLGSTHTEASTSWSGLFSDTMLLPAGQDEAVFAAEFSIVWS